MSTAVLEKVVEQPRKLDLVSTNPVPEAQEPEAQEKDFSDRHPLLPVLIAGAFSLVLAVTLVGAILAGLALRHSGIMAP
jgi:hypothetical protein